MGKNGPPANEPADPRPTHRPDSVPAPAVRRLSLYLRELEGLSKQDRQTTSSKQLGETLGYTDAQVRKDLAYFGQFGPPGIGYRVQELIARIRCILGTDRTWNAAVVGAGNLGQALLTYRGFARKGFKIVAIFDNDPAKVGRKIGSIPDMEIVSVDRLAEIVAQRQVQIGLIAVPAEVAQSVADELLDTGIRAILNFAPTSLAVPDNVPVASVELAVHLEQLAFRISAQP